jgi:hypothetical protein
LKDILQDNTNSKYLVSKDSVQYLQENQKFNKFKPLNSESEFVGCITARSNKISADNNFIEVDEKYYLSDNLIHDILKEGGGKIIPFQSVNAVNKRNKSGKRMYIRFPTFTNISSCINTIDFHGIKIRKKLEASYVYKEKTVNIEGVFSIVLTDFNIKLPSLMLVKMDDFADLSYKLVFEKK